MSPYILCITKTQTGNRQMTKIKATTLAITALTLLGSTVHADTYKAAWEQCAAAGNSAVMLPAFDYKAAWERDAKALQQAEARVRMLEAQVKANQEHARQLEDILNVNEVEYVTHQETINQMGTVVDRTDLFEVARRIGPQ